MAPAETPVRRVEIVLDIICAHSYIGYARFTEAARRFRADGGRLEVTFLPFQLDQDSTSEGEPLIPVLLRKFGPDALASTERVAKTAAADGLDLRFAEVVHTQTFDAHRQILHAARSGRAEEMTERLFRAYFTEGLNVADPDVLAGLGQEVGVDKPMADGEGTEETRTMLEHVHHRMRVRSIPQFLFDDGTVLSGAQPVSAFEAALRAAAPHVNAHD
ncbi:DsbA family oxidoreductase [Kitasatospora sp. NPDC004614]|uniref:DsbA family oxidoreductase n=1 Tax=unclassified Kitasatospora TaxID=2633591 RepID=UPI00368F9E5E